MKKNVWIINHYAGNTFFEKGGRHYAFAKYLRQAGYNPVVFCCNAQHNSEKQSYLQMDGVWEEQIAEEIGVPYVFVQGRTYTGNGKQRILNMVDFYRNVKKTAKEYAALHEKPDVIYASSVHPLTLIAGQQLAKRFGVRCVCEIRDLWPESLVAYGMLKAKSPVAKVLYLVEKRIYQKADRIVMTWPGGYDYIRDKGWEKAIRKEKVVHISNGVDLAEYRQNISAHPYRDPGLEQCEKRRFIYAGSIRKVNNLGILIRAAEILEKENDDRFELFVFGDGDERGELEDYVIENDLSSVVFKGKVPKKEIPSVLAQSDINILHNSSTSLDKYGQSQNKFFEYLASGRPVLMTYSVGHSVVREEECGIEIERQTPEAIADAIRMICGFPQEKIDRYSRNALACAAKYDFEILTEKVISVIEEL